MPVGRRRRRGDASDQKRSRNINSAAQPAKIGLFSQAAMESEVKRARMNQSSCPRSRPALIVMRRSMLVPSTEHLKTLASRSAVSSDCCAPPLENDVWDDIEPIANRFFVKICWIRDLIVSILDLHPPEHHDITRSKKRVFRHSDACQHHEKRYGA